MAIIESRTFGYTVDGAPHTLTVTLHDRIAGGQRELRRAEWIRTDTSPRRAFRIVAADSRSGQEYARNVTLTVSGTRNIPGSIQLVEEDDGQGGTFWALPAWLDVTVELVDVEG